jgi:hypothetical protein
MIEPVQTGDRLTLIGVSPGLHTTFKAEVEVVSYDPDRRHLVYVLRGQSGNHRRLILDELVFKGWNLPIVCDIDSPPFEQNDCINLIGDPEQLRELISEKNLNKRARLGAVLVFSEVIPRKNPIPLFPEYFDPNPAVRKNRSEGNRASERERPLPCPQCGEAAEVVMKETHITLFRRYRWNGLHYVQIGRGQEGGSETERFLHCDCGEEIPEEEGSDAIEAFYLRRD